MELDDERSQAEIQKQLDDLYNTMIHLGGGSSSSSTVETQWDDAGICKFYLVQFCPHDLFANTECDMGVCPLIHDDMLKKSFLESPRRDSCEPVFEAELALYCSLLVAKPKMRNVFVLENESKKSLKQDEVVVVDLVKNEQRDMTAEEQHHETIGFCEVCESYYKRDSGDDRSHYSSKNHESFKMIHQYLKEYKERRKMRRGGDMLSNLERKKIDDFRMAILEKRNPAPDKDTDLWNYYLWTGYIDITRLDDLDLEEFLREDAEEKECQHSCETNDKKMHELLKSWDELKLKSQQLMKEIVKSEIVYIKLKKEAAESEKVMSELHKEKAKLIELLKKRNPQWHHSKLPTNECSQF